MLETIAAAYSGFIGSISNYLYTYILIVLLVAGGIYFTVRTKFVQFRFLPESIRIVMQPSEDQNSISAFKTLMVSTASRVGTGNIAGISTAICLGGTGAVFWMWVTALLGSATAFVEGTLAQIYKKRAKDGSCYGGPAYYIEQALKQRWLGVLFAVVMILTYMVGFNLVASFNIADSLKAYSFYDPTLTPWIVGIVLAVVFLVCISGGGKQIANITAVLVPVMGVLYLAVTLFVVFTHISLIPAVFSSIFRNAFNFQAIFGGLVGSALMQGIKRGLCSNEAGIGAAACAAGMPFVQQAMAGTLGQFGVIFITVALFLFAFTTLLGNFYYAETGLSYLFNQAPSRTAVYVQRAIATVVVCLGATMQLNVVSDTAAVLMGRMALNIVPVIVLLLKPALRCLDDYIQQKKSGKNPEFKASSIGLKEKVDFWN